MKKPSKSKSKSKKKNHNKNHQKNINQQIITNLESPSAEAVLEPSSQTPELPAKIEPETKQLVGAAQEPPIQVEKQVSEKQLEANRRNAQQATGPISEQGKAISSQNSVSHGAYTGNILIKSETPQEFNAFYQGLYKCINPKDELYALYVDDYIWASWKARRFRIYEARVLNEKSSDALESIREIDRLTRIEQRIERNRERALKKIDSYKKQLFNEEMHRKTEEIMARRGREIEKQRNSSHTVIPSVGVDPCVRPTTNPQTDSLGKTSNDIPPSVDKRIAEMLSKQQHPLMGKGKTGSFLAGQTTNCQDQEQHFPLKNPESNERVFFGSSGSKNS